MNEESANEIISGLFIKGITKQLIYKKTYSIFNLFKQQLQIYEKWISSRLEKYNHIAEASYKETGDFEAEVKFGGDTLVFMMHTNIFTFPEDHFIFKTNYVKEDPLRAYTGMIMVYNFLSDSIKYNRVDDIGYLMANIFINKEGHFFVQGQRQLSFLFRDFSNLEMNKKNIRLFIDTSIKQAIDFDLLVPPTEAFNQITLMQKIQATETFALKTGKRLGFDIDIYDSNNHKQHKF
jgi:hypothetical protein